MPLYVVANKLPSNFSIFKRALAPFFVISAELCLLIASRRTEPNIWWLGLCCLVILLLLPQERALAWTWLSCLLVGFCALLFVNALYFNAAFHAQGFYYPLTLLIAFVVVSRNPVWWLSTGFKLFCSMMVVLAVWALLQWLTGWGFIGGKNIRAMALFATPNILAALLNLGLVPVLAYYLLGLGDRKVYALTLLLFAALLATQSRGGYLGLLVSLLFLVVFVGQSSILTQWRRYRVIAFGFMAVLLFFKVYALLGLASWSLDPVLATLSHGDSSSRWEIYQVAGQGLLEHLWLGIGYYNFGYYFEGHKVAPFLDRSITFVHNDYLQFAIELGLVGLGLFLLLLFRVYGQLLRFRHRAVAEQRVALILAATAMTSMLAHALVDYPFYIPIMLATFGAYLAIINQQLIDMGAAYKVLPKITQQTVLGLRPAFISKGLLLAFMLWLGLPAFSQMASLYGLNQLQRANTQSGLAWYGVARMLQPRSPVYYWNEGQVWQNLGVAQKKSDLLEKSIALFNKGIEVNGYEVNNLLAKIALYRQYGYLLKQPATPLDMMAWINLAKLLQPFSLTVQMEEVRCLAFVGEHQKAREQAQLLLTKRPLSKTVQNLLASVSHD